MNKLPPTGGDKLLALFLKLIIGAVLFALLAFGTCVLAFLIR